MILKNTENAFGAIAKNLHWIVAILICGLLVLGFYMTGLDYSPDKLNWYSLHKSLGVLVLWLAGLRLLWSLYTLPPLPLETHKLWERALSKLTHIALYSTMILMPLSGYIMSASGEYGVSFFGYNLPNIVPQSALLSEVANETHQIIAYVLTSVIMLHVLGALKHHVIDKDKTLLRMLPSFFKSVWFTLLILCLIAFVATVLKYGFVGKLEEEVDIVEMSREVPLTKETKVSKHKNQWDIVQDQSEIKFQTNVYGSDVTWVFSDFTGTIIFDVNEIAASSANIEIDLKNVSSGDVQRDSYLMNESWFNVVDYPRAYFTSLEFQHIEGENYLLVGQLGLAGKAMPVSFPFTLDIASNSIEEEHATQRAYVQGALSLNRLDFDLGVPKWEGADIVAHDVQVYIRLVAEK